LLRRKIKYKKMEEIKELSKDEFKDFMRIVLNAYPRFKMHFENEALGFEDNILKESKYPSITHVGYFQDNNLYGVMRFHDLTMNFYSHKIDVGGMGLLAVDLLHKKEHIAKKMMTYYLQHYSKKGVCILILYPFQTEFYRKMGFGYGTKINQYRINPSGLQKGISKEHLQYISNDQKNSLLECYTRFFKKTHGMIEKTEYEINELFDDPDNIIVGYENNRKILGYIVFSFQRGINKDIYIDNRYKNDIYVKEFIYKSNEVLLEMLTFLHSQADQINRIIFNTQDEYFHHLLLDVGNGSDNVINPLYHECNVSGVGIMYRAINIEGIFNLLKYHNTGNQNCIIKFNIRDGFFKENDGSIIIHFKNGTPSIKINGGYDVEVSMDVSDFSSLVMGVINLKSLHRYGLVEISDNNYIEIVNAVLQAEERPMCITGF